MSSNNLVAAVLCLIFVSPSLQDARIPSQCGLTCGEYTLGSVGATFTINNTLFPSTDHTAAGTRCICNWLVHAPASSEVRINFDPNFKVDTFLTVLDYGSGTDKVMAICGNNRDYSSPVGACDGLVSSRGSLLVQLDTDPADDFKFQATFTATNEPPTTGITPLPNKPTSLDCACRNGQLQVTPGNPVHLNSPNYPSQYENYCYCLWTLVAPPGFRIRADLGYIHTEQLWDYVVFYNRHAVPSGLTYQQTYWCSGDTPYGGNIVSDSNTAAFTFVSDRSNTEGGFSTTITAVNCSEVNCDSDSVCPLDKPTTTAVPSTSTVIYDPTFGPPTTGPTSTSTSTSTSPTSTSTPTTTTPTTTTSTTTSPTTTTPSTTTPTTTTPTTTTPTTTTPTTTSTSTTSTSTTPTTTTRTTTLAPTNYRDCSDVARAGGGDGIHTVTVNGHTFRVRCQTIRGRMWTLIQRQSDAKTDFDRDWADYAAGFGTLGGSFWLGLDRLHWMTTSRVYSMRVDLRSDCGDDHNEAWETYDLFRVESEMSNYRLGIGGRIEGPLGDSLKMFSPTDNFAPFSTRDRDNDRSAASCSQQLSGGWWFSSCGGSNLNGKQVSSCAGGAKAAFWKSWHGLLPTYTQIAIAPLH